MPPFVVFSDATLEDMAEKRPINEDEMEQVHGVGAFKLKKYGARFLAVIRAETAGPVVEKDTARPGLSGVDEEIYEAMDLYRKYLAEKNGTTAPSVFTNQVLGGMLKEKPREVMTLMNLPGVSSAAALRYGGGFLRLLERGSRKNFFDSQVWNRLRKYRRDLAKSLKIGEEEVFTDTQLRLLVLLRPKNAAETAKFLCLPKAYCESRGSSFLYLMRAGGNSGLKKEKTAGETAGADEESKKRGRTSKSGRYSLFLSLARLRDQISEQEKQSPERIAAEDTLQRLSGGDEEALERIPDGYREQFRRLLERR